MKKILAFDLELTPNVAHVWGLWKNNVSLNQLLESQEVMCWAAMWVGTDEPMFGSTFHDGKRGMLEGLWCVLNEADIVMGWNSKNFDIKHANREFIEAGLTPYAPVKHIDLMQIAKSKFRFPSNKLDYVAQRLLGEGKVSHSGHELWIRCMANDPDAWEEMKEYNIQDVLLLPKLYEKFLPWDSNHPTMVFEPKHCPSCGAQDVQYRGYYETKVTVFRRVWCPSCGSFGKLSKRSGIVSSI